MPNLQSWSNGFALALAILAGMMGVMIYTGVTVVRGFRGLPPRPAVRGPKLGLPFLALAGLGVAGYLAYVATRGVPALCGPIGDCQAVQGTPYARWLGVPVGWWGVMGYVAILAAWLWGEFRSDGPSSDAPLAMFCLSLFGTMLSAYLTYLELFVIGAVCLWCLASAVIMTLLLLLSVGPMWQAVAATEVKAESD